MKVYRADSNGAPWRSGSDEEFTEWHQLMEYIIQVMDSENVGNVQEIDDTSRQFDFVSPCASDKQATERDLRVDAELVRSKNLHKFSKSSRSKMAPPSETEQSFPPILTPTDRLAIALSEKLEADTKAQLASSTKDLEQEMLQPSVAQTPRKIYSIDHFHSIVEVLSLIGVQSGELLAQYCKSLVDHGFETPDLLMGLDLDMINRLGFRTGHAIKFSKVLHQFEEYV